MVNHFWNMESNVVNSNSHETNPSAGSTLVREEIQLTEKSVNISPFINQAAISWNERRKEWVGDQSQKSHKMPREQVISWSTTYDDLLSTNQPFSQSIPLTEMVDFLVDIWHEEGLYDHHLANQVHLVLVLLLLEVVLYLTLGPNSHQLQVGTDVWVLFMLHVGVFDGF
ncbi:uncharacterized protein LOC143855500 isoform X1 [Tasmannia lanceolata]|uniref:uncharacterized protein LOC143855500 isoform X1 n=1 Tax=Tasmannia lanceolata TaxID=3420 RepID=UPI0040642132